jgi:hypothetical protein
VREEVTGGWRENCIMRSILIFIPHQYDYHDQKEDETLEPLLLTALLNKPLINQINLLGEGCTTVMLCSGLTLYLCLLLVSGAFLSVYFPHI